MLGVPLTVPCVYCTLIHCRPLQQKAVPSTLRSAPTGRQGLQSAAGIVSCGTRGVCWRCRRQLITDVLCAPPPACALCLSQQLLIEILTYRYARQRKKPRLRNEGLQTTWLPLSQATYSKAYNKQFFPRSTFL